MSKLIGLLATLVITSEMIAEAKAAHGEEKVKTAVLPLDDEGKHNLEVLLKVPTRLVLGEFEKWSDRDPNKAKEILINACLLTFKDQVKSCDEAFFTCVNAIGELFPIRKGIIKNS